MQNGVFISHFEQVSRIVSTVDYNSFQINAPDQCLQACNFIKKRLQHRFSDIFKGTKKRAFATSSFMVFAGVLER